MAGASFRLATKIIQNGVLRKLVIATSTTDAPRLIRHRVPALRSGHSGAGELRPSGPVPKLCGPPAGGCPHPGGWHPPLAATSIAGIRAG